MTAPSKGMSSWWWQPSFWLWLVIRGHFWVRLMTLWSSRWDIFSGEMNYISPVSPERTIGSLHLIWPWINFVSDGSLFSPEWYPYQIPRKCWQQILSPVMSIKIYFFRLSSSSVSTKSFLSETCGLWASLELGTFILSFLFIKELCRQICTEKGNTQGNHWH